MSAEHTRPKPKSSTRTSLLSQPRTMVLALLAIVFTAYVLGYLPQLDGLFGVALENSRSHGLLIVGPIVLLIVGLFVLFILLLVLGFLGNLLTAFSRIITFFGRKHVTIEQFTAAAREQGLSPRVAKETYQLLKTHYPGKICISLEDELRRHLILKDDNIQYLQSKLLNRCDRREVLSFSVESIQTVFDLMQHAEGAPPQHVSGTVVRRRNIDRNPAALAGRRVDQRRQFDPVQTATDNDLRINERDRRHTSRSNDNDQRAPSPPSPTIESEQPSGHVRRSTPPLRPPSQSGTQLEDTWLASPSRVELSSKDRAEEQPRPTRSGEDAHFLPPRRREGSGAFRRVTDPALPVAADPARASSFDDPDFRPRTRPDYSGVLRRTTDPASDSAASMSIPASGASSEPTRRFGETGFRPRLPAIPVEGSSPTGTTNDNVLIRPRRISDTGFRRRTLDPPAIKDDSNKR